MRPAPVTHLALPCLLLAACAGPGSPDFDDHSEAAITEVAVFERLAKKSGSRAIVKFLLTEFDRPTQATRYLDSNFYSLHDEWYWFRLLNGQRIPGEVIQPTTDHALPTIDAIYTWARKQAALPLDLSFVSDGRLYSARFYREALTEPRRYGLGNLIHVAAREKPARPAMWLFELEYSDRGSHDQLVTFFEAQLASLPESIAKELRWLVRSPDQETLAQQMELAKLRFHDRIVRYSELSVPGEIEVYNAGLTAGRLHLLRAGDTQATHSTVGNVVVMDHVPDELPAGRALITSVPQTPLAHINLLAKNRGIPNAYLGGALDDPRIDQLERAYAPVAVLATVPDQLRIVALQESEFTQWRNLGTKAPVVIESVDLTQAAYVVDLGDKTLAQLNTLRPLIGGKAAGFLALAADPTITMPDTPVALTIRAYAEHVAPHQATIKGLLELPEFLSSTRTRYLLLEGQADYDVRYTSAIDQAHRDLLLSRFPAGDVVGDIARGGGLKGLLRARPIAPATLAKIKAALAARFGPAAANGFAKTQGLRFRSSSTVEDIEGFSGAGLYTSNTGFLDAAAQPAAKDQKRTIEYALKKTWASYWGFAAFEERRLERIDHLSGAMAVLVHARFDDAKELANGVFTLTLLPKTPRQGASSPYRARLELNVQKGAISVTNPVGNALPEVDRVTLANDGKTTITRVRASSLAAAGERLLDDDELSQLFAQARVVTENWLLARNTPRPALQRSAALVLDFEFRKMAAGWPAVASGTPFPSRMIIKQARPIDPGTRTASDEVRALPLPDDLLARSSRVLKHSCSTSRWRATALQLFTDPLVGPDLGFSRTPFTALVTLEAKQELAELSMGQGDKASTDHLAIATVGHGRGVSWRVDVAASLRKSLALSRFELTKGGRFHFAKGSAALEGSGATCTTEVLHATPTEYLRELIAKKDNP